jgi:DNA-binding response OmpR family regulator
MNESRLSETTRGARNGLTILIINGYDGNALENLQFGANADVLRKPFTLDELADRVHALLKKSAAPE